jgi:hypothetical protein
MQVYVWAARLVQVAKPTADEMQVYVSPRALTLTRMCSLIRTFVFEPYFLLHAAGEVQVFVNRVLIATSTKRRQEAHIFEGGGKCYVFGSLLCIVTLV